jgi:hypothetical protein
MVNTVIRTKVTSNWGKAACVLRVGAALVVLLCTVHALGAPEPGRADSAQGEAWVAASSVVPASGTVATAPAVATGVTPVASPTSPTAPTPSASAKPVPQPTADESADANPEALTLFRSQLDPYGNWVDDARYGRVWIPNRAVVGDNFSPYVTSGHWALDNDDNWNWVSDHPFGWVVFHYGRWFYSTEYGWAWVPGRAYAPNWVVWRLPTSTYAYVGWAPMPPRYGWFAGGAVWYSSYGTVSYVFCPSDYLFYPSVGLYLVSDPWMVSRLGIYTSFYYPPYYYGGYYGGYYGHHHGYYGNGHAGYRPAPYGPPINRTRISPRAIPRDRIAADPRAVAAAPRRTATPTSGALGFQRSPASGLSRATDGRTRSSAAPVVSPRSSSRSPAVTTTPRYEPRTVAPAVPRTTVPRSSAPVFTPRVRSAPTYHSPSVRSTPSFHTPSPRSTPSFHTPSPRSTPSFHAPRASSPRSSGGFGGGRRHR